MCVEKPDKSIRICIDYRDVNRYTVVDAFPMTRVDTLLDKVGRCQYISTLDATSGYWQIPVHPDSVDKTSFVTHRGQYAWRVLSFGLRNAAATFQKTMNEILAPHKDYSDAYIDDTAVFSYDWGEHLNHLDQVLQAFCDVGMTLKLSKCKFAMSTVLFVGHTVGSGVKSMDTSRIDAIMAMEPPDTKKKWRSFIGLVNYYRDYVPNMSSLLLPLTDLTKKSAPDKCI